MVWKGSCVTSKGWGELALGRRAASMESLLRKERWAHECIISHAKWARFWMAPNARPGECWIWWCFKNTNPQWVFSSVLYSRCYLLCKTTTATHTFSPAPAPNTAALYLSVQAERLQEETILIINPLATKQISNLKIKTHYQNGLYSSNPSYKLNFKISQLHLSSNLLKSCTGSKYLN